MNQLSKSSDTQKNNSSIKFFIKTCPLNEIKPSNILDQNDKRLILQAIYNVNSQLQNNKQLVIKISSPSSIKKEYEISEQLKDIPGFLKYICYTECYDKLEKYNTINTNTKICTTNAQTGSNLFGILVMPYIPDSSIRYFKWEDNVDLLKSTLIQLIISLYIAFDTKGFLHNDIHLDNVLMRRTKKNTIIYNIDGIDYSFKTNNYQVCILDFELSFINLKREWVHYYRDIYRIFSDLATHQALKIQLDNEHEILQYIMKYISNPKSLKFLSGFLQLINNIKSIKKQVPEILEYNPNKF